MGVHVSPVILLFQSMLFLPGAISQNAALAQKVEYLAPWFLSYQLP
jgi:hypothetical protein